MNRANEILIVLVPMAYVFVLVAYQSHAPRRLRPAWLLAGALILHFGQILARGIILGHVPLSNTYEALSALGFLIALNYLVVELVFRVERTGSDVLMWAFAMTTFGLALGPHEALTNERFANENFARHTVPAIVGVAAILTSGAFGLLYLRLSRAVKNKELSGPLFQRLPSLDVLARMNWWAALVGLFAVTGAIGWGATWYGEKIGRVDVSSPEIFLTLVMWSVLLLPVVGKLLRRWSDRATAVVAVITMGIVLLFFAVSILPIGFHGS